jgi:squalene-hopene/tetraprenyl-beta-curcumene cyclase
MSAPYVRRAVGWLKGIQKSDGGWGECCESYDDPDLKCTGKSTPSQTAWALLALIAAGEESGDEMMRGIAYLIEKQQQNGTWDEPEFTGTGFPKHFVINYHNYRNCFPLMALGRFLSKTSEKRKQR